MAYDPRTETGIPTEPVGSPPRPSGRQPMTQAVIAPQMAAEVLGVS